MNDWTPAEQAPERCYLCGKPCEPQEDGHHSACINEENARVAAKESDILSANSQAERVHGHAA